MRRLPLFCALLWVGSASPEAGATQGPAAPAIEAVGLVRASIPTRSTAILRSQGRTRVVAVGETAFGVRLLAIGSDTVQLELGGQPVELRLAPAPASPALPPPRASSLPSDAPP